MAYVITVELTVTGCTDEDEAVHGTSSVVENLIGGDIADAEIVAVKEK